MNMYSYNRRKSLRSNDISSYEEQLGLFKLARLVVTALWSFLATKKIDFIQSLKKLQRKCILASPDKLAYPLQPPA
jgi:hypothetical protein